MVTGKYTHSGPSLVALAPDLGTVAIACNSDVSFYKAATTEHDMTIADVHTSKISLGRDLFIYDLIGKFQHSVTHMVTDLFLETLFLR